MHAARGQGMQMQAVLHVAGDQGIAAPLRSSADAHLAAEGDNAPKEKGKGWKEKGEVEELGRESDAESGRTVRGLAGAGCKDPRVGSSPLGLRFRKVPKPGMYPEGFSPYVMRPRQVPTTKYLPPPSPPRPHHRPPSCFARRDSEVARFGGCARAQSYHRRLLPLCADVQFKDRQAHCASIAPGDPARP